MKKGVESIDRVLYSKLLMHHFGLSKDDIKKIGMDKPKDVKLSIKEIDLGKVKRKKNHPFAFELINLGEKPILIYTIRISCSCVEINIPKKPILPNSSCKIEGVFESKHKGKFERILSIHTNSQQTPLQALTLKGAVI